MFHVTDMLHHISCSNDQYTKLHVDCEQKQLHQSQRIEWSAMHTAWKWLRQWHLSENLVFCLAVLLSHGVRHGTGSDEQCVPVVRTEQHVRYFTQHSTTPCVTACTQILIFCMSIQTNHSFQKHCTNDCLNTNSLKLSVFNYNKKLFVIQTA